MTIANYYKCDDCCAEWLATTDNRVKYNNKKLCPHCYKKIIKSTNDFTTSHSGHVINESFIQKICSFFIKRESCRGYDLTSPIGRIADRAFKHWNDVERKEESIKKLSAEIAQYRNITYHLDSRNRQLEDDINYYKKKLADARDIFKNMYKVKWDETDPLKWNEPRLEDKVIHKERIFSADTLKEAEEIANQTFGLCSFTLHRYNEELGDFDEEDLAWKVE